MSCTEARPGTCFVVSCRGVCVRVCVWCIWNVWVHISICLTIHTSMCNENIPISLNHARYIPAWYMYMSYFTSCDKCITCWNQQIFILLKTKFKKILQASPKEFEENCELREHGLLEAGFDTFVMTSVCHSSSEVVFWTIGWIVYRELLIGYGVPLIVFRAMLRVLRTYVCVCITLRASWRCHVSIDVDCFYYHSWRNNVVIAFGTLSSFTNYESWVKRMDLWIIMCAWRMTHDSWLMTHDLSLYSYIYIYKYIYIYVYIYVYPCM